jgi:hypothetical protein
MKEMKRKRAKSNKNFLTSLLVFATISILLLPAINAGQGSGGWVPVPRRLGIQWVHDGDSELANTKKDAEGFMNHLLSDGWQCDFNKHEQYAHDEQWETSQDQYYVDKVHIAYYAGHGYKTYILVHKKGNPAGRPEERAEWYNCNWGDENNRRNYWVALATCLCGYGPFGHSMHGTHLILGWSTQCDDKVYGPVFADYMILHELQIKSAWFATGGDLAVNKSTMSVLGEDGSVGTDYLFGHGNVNPDPSDDWWYTQWECDVGYENGNGARWYK